MRPLQENRIVKPMAETVKSTTALQPMPPIATTKSLSETISSYKRFEATATAAGQTPSDLNRNLSNLLRSTSLDSLANSSEQDCSSSSSSDCSDDNADNQSTNEADQLSDVDSINGNEQISEHNNKKNNFFNQTTVNAVVHCKSDLNDNDISENNHDREPVIKSYLEKLNSKCEYKNCVHKHIDSHSNDNLNGNFDNSVDLNGINGSNGFVLVQPNQKTRRTSVASSGSIGRMETIIEEPIEPKISVKQILAHFETLTSAEVEIKFFTFFIILLNIFSNIM